MTVIFASGTTTDEAQIHYAYDLYGNVAAYTDELGRVTRYEYDIMDRLTRVTQADPDDYTGSGGSNGSLAAPVTTFVYDVVGRMTSTSDALGRTTRFVYDAKDRLVATIDPMGGVLSSSYDRAGNLIATSDQLGRTTTFESDERGRIVQLTDPEGGVTRFEYDGNDNLVSMLDPEGNLTSYRYDSRNRLSAEVDAADNVTRYVYDAADQLVKAIDGLGNVTEYQYEDELGNLTTMLDDLGQKTEYSYDKVGNLLTVKDHQNKVTTYGYDARDRLIQIVDANTGAGQGVTAFAYLDNGLLHTLTDPEANVTTFDYDRLDRLTKETNELGDERSFGYYADGNLKSKTDRNGRLTEYFYDPLNRLKTEEWKQGSTLLHTISYGYKLSGELTTATSNLPSQNPYSSLVYAYDDNGRVKTVTDFGTGARPDVALESAYDSASRRTSLVAKIDGVTDFTNTYAYDALSRMTQVKQSGTNVASKRVDFAYDAVGQFAAITRYADLAGAERVVTSIFSHDDMGRLEGLSHALAGASTLAYAWTYDTLNRVATFTDPDGQTIYSYDNTSQLVGADRPGTADDETYSYDTNGNRDYGGYATGANNQMTSDGIYNYSYDDEGNRRTRSKSGEYTEYTWDHRNRLVAVDTWTSSAKSVKSSGVEYAYDAFDRRIGKSVDGNGDGDLADAVDWGESFVYDGDHIALVFDEDGSLKSRYLHGPAIDQVLAEETVDSLGLSDEVYWQLVDDLGSIRDVLTYNAGTNTATQVKHLIYDAFGQIIDDTAPLIEVRFAFTGRELDIETGLYYYRARYYDATNGRFISEDPIGFEGWDENLTRYVFNSPTNFSDPTGHGLWSWIWTGHWSPPTATIDTNGRRHEGGKPPEPKPSTPTPGTYPSQWTPCSTREDWEKETGEAIDELEYQIAKALAERALDAAGGKVLTVAAAPIYHLGPRGLRRLAKYLGNVPLSQSPVAQGRSKGTLWWEYISNDKRRIIIVQHLNDNSIHVGIPKPQSRHLCGEAPHYYELPGTGHVGSD